MNTENAPQVEMVSELPELPMHKGFLCLHNTGGISQVHGYTADQMRAYAQAALNARAGSPNSTDKE